MMSFGSHPAARSLPAIVHDVRRRWRLKLLLRGSAIVGGAALSVFLLSSWALERLGFSAGALLAIRLVAYAALLIAAYRYLVRPLLRRVSDDQVALYLEEHDPDAHQLLVTALAVERERAAQGMTGPPAMANLEPMARRTVERALAACARMEDGRSLERGELRRFGGALAAVALVALVLMGLRPAMLRHGAGALLNPLRGAAASSPYSIEVQPGDVTVPRGADQKIRALLRGFQAGDAAVVVRSGSDSAFQRVPLVAGDSGLEVLLFDLEEPTEYFVEAGGVRSGVYHIRVADLPYVKNLALEYHYPAYTGLEPEKVESGGDVAAIRGTRVQVQATTTVPAAGGTIVLSSGNRYPLERDSAGAWTGAFPIQQRGFYHIELKTAEGKAVTGSADYAIDLLADRRPTVRLAKPGRDTRPTSVDEVYLEAVANDDYGIGSIELHYAVNGGAEQSISLYRSAKALRDVSAGHTLYLEEMGLHPGDVVSYYARARDNDPGSPPATSDIYFLTIRPFGREYRQADSGGPPGGGGQQGQNAGEMTRQQREIVAATFNLVRDSANYTTSAYREYLNTIALMQDRLKQQVLGLAQRMRNRQVTADTMFAQIASILPEAGRAMDSALAALKGPGPRPALPPEQRALQQLERAEALYRDVQVQLQQAAGGGGGGSSPNAEDLADLFELELDKLRNQYETVQRGEREQSGQQVDATVEKLRELAQRLQQENERLRRQAMQPGQRGGSGGDAQRQLAQELEQAARQLDRLSRDQPRQDDLQRAARELEQAADALRRGAADARSGNTAGARQALDRLREATRRLEQGRGSDVERETRDALERAERLAEQQRQTGDRMEDAARHPDADGKAAQELIDRRTQQHTATTQLEQELDRLSAASRRDQPDASRKLESAAAAIRDSHLEEMQRFSRNLMRDGVSPDMIRQFENRIDQATDTVLQRLRAAASAFRPDEQSRLADGLDRASDLVRGLQSMQERTRAAADANANRQSNPNGGQPGADRGQQNGNPQANAGNGQDRNGNPQGNGQRGESGRQADANAGRQGGQGQQANAGQQGSPNGGRRGDPTGASGPGGGGWANPSGGGGRIAPRLTPDQARQLRAEAAQRLADAEALRRELRQQGRDVGGLDDVITGMRQLNGQGIYATAEQLQKVQADVLESMKAFEFSLRRSVLGESREKLHLSGSDEVPPGFRAAVEAYYRSLSRGD